MNSQNLTTSAIRRPTAVLLALVIAMALNSGCATTSSSSASTGEPTHDGLMPLSGTRAQRVWVRPGFDLAGYTKIMLIGAGIQYRPVKELTGTRTFHGSRTEFPMTEQAKQDLERLITDEFDKALAKLTRFEEVKEPGPDVLMVRGAFLDVVSRVPPEGPGRTDYYLDSVGQATFMVEMIDSQSGSVMIRAVDTRAAQTRGYTPQSNRVTNTAEARRLFARWANMLVEALNEVTSLESLNTNAE